MFRSSVFYPVLALTVFLAGCDSSSGGVQAHANGTQTATSSTVDARPKSPTPLSSDSSPSPQPQPSSTVTPGPSPLPIPSDLPAGFTPAFTAIDGTVWSQVLPAQYTNGCVNADGQYDPTQCSRVIRNGKESAAEGVCEKIGATLPTRDQELSLVFSFDHAPYDSSIPWALTPDAVEKFGRLFGISTETNTSFWTRSTEEENVAAHENAYVLEVYFWMPGDNENSVEYGAIGKRSQPASVSCVVTPSAPASNPILDTSYYPIYWGNDLFMGVLPDGSALSAGEDAQHSENGGDVMALSRRDSLGDLDPSFKGDAVQDPPSDNFMNAMYPLHDGTFLLRSQANWSGSGSFEQTYFRKVNAQGKFDTKYGKKGVFAVPNTQGSTMSVYGIRELPDGSVVGAMLTYGSVDNYYFLLKITPNGQIDGNFGKSGFVQTESIYVGTGVDATRLILSKNGITVFDYGGDTYDGNRMVTRLAHVSYNGVLDQSFGDTGWKVIPMLADGCLFQDAIDDGQEHLLFVQNCPSSNTVVVSRYDQNGAIDPSFANSGSISLPYSLASATEVMGISGVKVIRDGEILVMTEFADQSYFLDETSQPKNMYVDRVAVAVLRPNGSPAVSPPAQLVIPDSARACSSRSTPEYFDGAPVFRAGQDAQGRVLISYFDGENSIWFRTSPVGVR